MSFYYGYKPYVPVAQRRAKAAKTAQKMMENGQKLNPVTIEGRKISSTFWGNAWCENLENYSDYENRLPRGRTYARNGSVIHLEIQPTGGKISALVQGSDLYKIEIAVEKLPDKKWKEIKKAATGKITNLLDLLQGKLPKDLLATITDQKAGLFPLPQEIKMSCSCPDYSSLCKHIAAVIYGIGNRLDRSPELFFTMRSLDMSELLSAAGKETVALTEPATSELDAEDLSALFGVEMESPSNGDHQSPQIKAKNKTAKKAPNKKIAAKKAVTKKVTKKKQPKDKKL
jgi:uncharacterized Zn finger protein